MLKEFKSFILMGNLVELAVAFIMGIAFAAVVGSLVADVITPVVGAIFQQPDFGGLTIEVGQAEIRYGAFLNQLLTLLIVALVCFAIVKTYNRLRGPEVASTKDCPYCLSKVPLGASRCSACTSQLEGADS
jgi:large conductance mechanosensitive channel